MLPIQAHVIHICARRTEADIEICSGRQVLPREDSIHRTTTRRSWTIKYDGGSSWSYIRLRFQIRAGRIHGGDASIILKGVRAGRGKIENIEAERRVFRGVVGYDYRRIARNNVSSEHVPHGRRYNPNARNVSRYNIVLDNIVRGRPEKTESEVGADGPDVTIAAKLIPQHPVAAAVAENSYPAAGKFRGAIPYRDVSLNVNVGGVADQNARITICRGRNVRYKTSVAVTKIDARCSR